MMNKMNIAIIGAGMSGIIVAEKMQPYANVQIFEKARGVGGRMSTRYADDYQFDHGAKFFTARSDSFKDFLQPLIGKDIVRE